MIPPSTARSSIQGRPPLGWGGLGGSRGWIADQISSGTSCSAMVRVVVEVAMARDHPASPRRCETTSKHRSAAVIHGQPRSVPMPFELEDQPVRSGPKKLPKLVALVRAGSAQHREPLVLGGHQRHGRLVRIAGHRALTATTLAGEAAWRRVRTPQPRAGAGRQHHRRATRRRVSRCIGAPPVWPEHCCGRLGLSFVGLSALTVPGHPADPVLRCTGPPGPVAIGPIPRRSLRWSP